MSNLRESLAATTHASLEWSEERERAVDRVAASGRVPGLGLLIWKARYMLESRAYQDATKGLLKRYLSRYRNESEEIALKCVEQALSEFLGSYCQACTGSREITVGALRVPCSDCGGSGVKRYRDTERAGRMKLSLAQVRLLGHKIEWLQNEIGTLDRQVNEVMAHELERG